MYSDFDLPGMHQGYSIARVSRPISKLGYEVYAPKYALTYPFEIVKLL